MRNIKYRAKAMSGEWVYGNFIHSKRFEGCSNEFRIHNQETGLESDIEIDTLCQLVAFRNGIEFYEHDILEDFLSIRWNEEDASFEFYWTYSGESTNGDINWCENDSILKEVVGNIFDNPEMVGDAVS
jgi:hypothetical protein